MTTMELEHCSECNAELEPSQIGKCSECRTKAQDEAYRKAAREQWEVGANDELEIDADAKVSAGDDNGAWVQAWVWVADIDAGICSSCGDVNADNGEGWDGLCGNCADKAEDGGTQ